jgi:hypothetical protein
MNASSQRIRAFEAAMVDANLTFAAGDAATAFALLERAHVLGQREFGRHLRVHFHMLRVAWAMRGADEIRGQLLRIALVPVGHLVGRLPIGNTGGSNVSAFKPMAIPPDLERLLEDKWR